MKKRIVALILALCLCVACLPLSAGAEDASIQMHGDLESIDDFLERFQYIYLHSPDFTTYDSSKATVAVKTSDSISSANMLEHILAYTHCYSFRGFHDDIYPGEPIEEIQGRDPRKKWGQYGGGYIKISVEKTAWIMENIYNFSHSDYKAMESRVAADKNKDIYILDGYFYINKPGGIGGMNTKPVVTNSLKRAGRSCVIYEKRNLITNSVDGYKYAIVEPKTIDGNTYWSIYFDTGIKAWDDPLASGGFVDVPAGSYITEPVKWAVENGITSGTGTATFSPDQSCTRAQAVTFLWNAAGKPEPQGSYSPFTDVSPTDWYYKAVLWAVENDITSGIGKGKFNPSGTCSRGQIVTFLWRAKGQPFAGSPGSFVDVAKGAYYENAVSWAVENSITGGIGGGRFNPDGTCTRGQIVTFLYRAADVPEVDPLDSCRDAYAYFLRTYEAPKNTKPKFQLIYLDDDDIPELVIAVNDIFATGTDLYCFKNGQMALVEHLFTPYGTMNYAKRNSMILASIAHTGEYFRTFYAYEKGKATKLKEFQIHNYPPAIGETEEWKIDGVDVTETEFNQQIAPYEAYTYSSAGYSTGFAINESNIQRMLQHPESVM